MVDFISEEISGSGPYRESGKIAVRSSYQKPHVILPDVTNLDTLLEYGLPRPEPKVNCRDLDLQIT
jgi:hypothetical protein|tara:strand:+ start:414 stop:611 length:198 start_codon:yes stop_codon:yes gene_type:complete